MYTVDGLRADPPAEIYPVTVTNEVRFIGLRAHGERDVAIRYRRWP